MKGSRIKVSFSSPSSPRGSDENGRSNQQKKTFMSPTISAASKVTRKKILGERNESPLSNSNNTHFSKSPNLDSNPSPKTIPKVVSHKISSPNLEPTPVSYNSKDGTPSPGPYDPLKNYLSPRPQFLRYNPGRRKEIFSRLEMEDKEGDDHDEADTVSSENSSSSSLESSDESESLFEESEEESDAESEEELEEEKEVTWSFRAVLKYLFLSVALVLSTSYISSMNAPVAAPAFEGASATTLGFQNLSFGIVEGFEVEHKFWDLKQEQSGLLSFSQVIDDEVIEEFASLEIDDSIVEYEEMVEDEFEQELIMMEEDSVQFAENIELEEIEDVIEENGGTQSVIEDELVGDNIEQLEQQSAEEIEFVQVDRQASLLSEGTYSSEEIQMVEVPKEASEDIHHKEVLQVAVNMLQKCGKSIALKFQELNLQGLHQDMGTGVAILVFGLLTCAAIVASFVFGSNMKRNGNAPKQSSPADDKHSTRPVAVKENSPSLPVPAERDEPKKLAISDTIPWFTTSVVPVGSRAPSVELLAEFDVCGISRSVKSTAGGTINSRMKDDEVSSSSNYSYFSEQGFSQLSAGNSNSSGRSIAKKKQSRKELGSNDLAGEGRNNEAMTPLRRSTRIRKRVDIASP